MSAILVVLVQVKLKEVLTPTPHGKGMTPTLMFGAVPQSYIQLGDGSPEGYRRSHLKFLKPSSSTFELCVGKMHIGDNHMLMVGCDMPESSLSWYRVVLTALVSL